MSEPQRSERTGVNRPWATHFVDAHHVQHWADGGKTCMDNLVQLCRRHHRLVHEGGFGIGAYPAGDFVFSLPDGKAIPNTADGRSRGNVHEIREANRRNGLEIIPKTGVSRWTAAWRFWLWFSGSEFAEFLSAAVSVNQDLR